MGTSIETREKLINLYNTTQIRTNLNIRETKDSITIHFIKNPFVEIKGNSGKTYRIQFIDADTDTIFYENSITPNHWITAARKWYTKWLIRIYDELTGEKVHEQVFNAEGKRVYIHLDSKSLGDTLAWFPYVEEFRKKHRCKIVCSTFWNELFESEYPEIEFCQPGTEVRNLYAMYEVGIFEQSNRHQHKKDPRLVPLQQACSDYLGIEYKEIIPKIAIKNKNKDLFGKYACVATASTCQAKYWNNPGAWDKIGEYLKSKGIEPVIIQKEFTDVKNMTNRTGDKSIHDRIAELYHCEFFIGISSGLSWLAWALHKPVVLISGFTLPYNEFTSECIRIFNEKVCTGCMNDISVIFNKGDWNWCPRLKDTPRQFECSKQISIESVKSAIDELVEKKRGDEFFTHEFPDKKVKIMDYFDPSKTWKEQPIKSILTYEEIFNQKEYEKGGAIIEAGDVVLDIGAHIGIFTKYALQRGASKVIAFEPGKDNYELFLKNIPPTNGAECYQYAVGDKSGQQTLYIDSHHIHSIFPEPGNPTKTGAETEIYMTTLDDIIKEHSLTKIDFMKIDIEGAEIRALKGISDENLKKIKKISIEYHNQAFNYDDSLKESIISRFVKLGFKFYIRYFLNSNAAFIMHFWQ